MKYTRKQQKEINSRKTALGMTLKGILSSDARLKAECAGNGESVEIEGEGGLMTQLWMVATMAAKAIKDIEKRDGGKDTRYWLLLAAIEMQKDQMDSASGGEIVIEV